MTPLAHSKSRKMTYLGFDGVHWAQRFPGRAVSYKRLHFWLFHLFRWKWLIIPQNIARRTWLTDSSLWFWERKMLRRLAARVRGKSRDWSKKSLEMVLMVAPRDKREARQKDVTLKSRHPFSWDWKKKGTIKQETSKVNFRSKEVRKSEKSEGQHEREPDVLPALFHKVGRTDDGCNKW